MTGRSCWVNRGRAVSICLQPRVFAATLARIAMPDPFRRHVAELIATFFLVFAGCGAIVIDMASGGAVTHVGVALSFGLVVMTMIYAVGDVSGAHLNPAVTIGFAVSGRFAWSAVPGYIVSQVLGAVAAAALLRVLFPASMYESVAHLGVTLPAGPWWQSFVLEVVLTLFLMLVILVVATGAKEKGLIAAIAIGGTVGLEAMFAGPICGASMNPARSLGPALLTPELNHLWIYLTAPVLGAVLAVPLCRVMCVPGACCEPTVKLEVSHE